MIDPFAAYPGCVVLDGGSQPNSSAAVPISGPALVRAFSSGTGGIVRSIARMSRRAPT
jgi:hypothetical protein